MLQVQQIANTKLNYSLYENKIFIFGLCPILKNINITNKIINEIPQLTSSQTLELKIRN